MFERAFDARRQILEYASQKFNERSKRRTGPLTLNARSARHQQRRGGRRADPARRLGSRVVQAAGLPITRQGNLSPDSNWDLDCWAAHAAEIEVDTSRLRAGHEVRRPARFGQAINPFAVEQQIEGGVVMALGATFHRGVAP